MPPTPASLARVHPHWSLITLAAIVAGAIVLRALLFRGWVGFDDAEYASLAYQLVRGELVIGAYPGPAVFPLRVGIIAPAAASFGVLGLGDWTMVVYPLTISVLALVLVYLAGARIFGPIAGLVAALALALAPQDVEMATKLLPDLPAAVLGAGGVLCALHARDLRGNAALIGWGLLSGSLFGLSWLHKESVAYLAPFMFLLMVASLWSRRAAVLPLWIGVAVGSFGILFGEMAAYRTLTGDFLFRFHEVERNYDQWANGFFSEGSDFGWREGESYGAALARRLFVTGPAFLLLNRTFLYLPLAGVVAAAYGWLKRDRAFLWPALWLLALLLMFNFGSSSSESYLPLALFHRYIYPLAYPAAILLGGLVARQAPGLVEAVRTRRLPHAAAPAVLTCGIVFLSAAWQHQYPLRHRDEVRSWTAEVRELSDRIDPDATLYSDTLSLRGLSFYHEYPETVQWRDFERLDTAPAAGSLVLVNQSYLSWLQVNSGMWLSAIEGYRVHDFYTRPPSHWTEVWGNGNATLYRVEPGGDTGSP